MDKLSETDEEHKLANLDEVSQNSPHRILKQGDKNEDGDPARTRTWNLQIRSLPLYPVELRGRASTPHSITENAGIRLILRQTVSAAFG